MVGGICGDILGTVRFVFSHWLKWELVYNCFFLVGGSPHYRQGSAEFLVEKKKLEYFLIYETV